jgi:hypothetical protein
MRQVKYLCVPESFELVPPKFLQLIAMKVECLEFSQSLEGIGRQFRQQPIGNMEPLKTRR